VTSKSGVLLRLKISFHLDGSPLSPVLRIEHGGSVDPTARSGGPLGFSCQNRKSMSTDCRFNDFFLARETLAGSQGF